MTPTLRPLLRTSLLLAAPLYVASLLLTLPAAGILGGALERFAGSSAFLEHLEAGRWALFAGEFLPHSRQALQSLPATLAPTNALYLLLWVAAGAGIMAVFFSPTGQGLPAFGEGCLRLGPRVLGLSLLMLPAYALAAGAAGLPVFLAGEALAAGETEMGPFIQVLSAACAAGLAVAVAQTYHLAAKAALAAESGPFFQRLLVPFTLGRRWWLRMIGRYIAVVAGGGALILLFTAAAAGLWRTGVLAGLCLQLGVFCHVGARVVLHGLFARAVGGAVERPSIAVSPTALEPLYIDLAANDGILLPAGEKPAPAAELPTD